jgi:hypothetical protein
MSPGRLSFQPGFKPPDSMDKPKLYRKYLIACIWTALCSSPAASQVLIRGTLYDRLALYPLSGVSVMGTSGTGTVSDSLGHYSIRLSSKDSIYFSYLGKSTAKFPVKEIESTVQFDMSLDVAVDSLPSVSVWSPIYRLDSLENRREYEKIFDYAGGSSLDNMKTGRRGGIGVGFDMDMFFHPGANRRMLAFQQRLVEEEQDKYVDHRFTRHLVKRVTGLEAPALDTFMRWYRPSYEFTRSCATDWEFYEYIQKSGKNFLEIWKQDHPDSAATVHLLRPSVTDTIPSSP